MIPHTAKRLFVLSFAVLAPAFASSCAAPAGDDAVAAESAQSTDNAITLANWQDHPAIFGVRQLVSEIEMAIHDGALASTKRENLCEGEPGEDYREKWTDGSGRIEKLVFASGGGDHASAMTVYYDRRGTVRYVHSEFNDVWGGAEERLVYFAQNGEPLWEVIRERERSADPDYDAPLSDWRTPRPVEDDEFDTFAFSDHNVVNNPPMAFASEPQCY
jgi:hypothetical protein